MPTLSLAHFILTLWLLAAVAPAATVFIQGSWLALAPNRARSEDAAEVASPASPEKKSARAKITWRDDRGARLAGDWGSHFTDAASLDRVASVSLLHTALQRHRPRVA
jgi:hypothetical protein